VLERRPRHRRRDRRGDEAEEQADDLASEHGLLTLQRAAGNRAVARLLQREPETTKTEKQITSKVAMSTGKTL